MLVSRATFHDVIKLLSRPSWYSFDTETTGLNPYLGDRLFSLILATKSETYYFNFKHDYPTSEGVSSDYCLPREWIKDFNQVFSNPRSYFFAHNAKFDIHMLHVEGVEISSDVHCTEVGARILYNQYLSYSLEKCAERIGLEKDDAVETYITKHKLYTKHRVEGKKTEVRQPHYDKVPFAIIVPYGEKDARITFDLGFKQVEDLKRKELSCPSTEPSITKLHQNELRLTKTCFRMESFGIKVDRDYCERARDYEMGIARMAISKFEEMSGEPFVDSPEPLAKIFDRAGEAYPRTAPTKTRPKGTPSFTAEVLEDFDSPLALHLLNYRRASKRAGTYYANFVRLADSQGVIHSNLRQAGTATWRFSSSDPNLQNLSKPDEDDEGPRPEFEIRSAFIPRSSDFCFVMIDYDQMEYRMMLDYAGEKGLIEQVLAGLDVHQATANLMGVSRYEAKTINFMLLYGGGVAKLAKKLNISLIEAKVLKQHYFDVLPRVQNFIDTVILKARTRKEIFNWAGFRYHFPDREWAYVAPNHLIQGGCALVMRYGLNSIDKFLEGKKSRLLMTIHDEALLEIHKDELHLVNDIKNIMENIYPHNRLPLTAGVSHSWKSWGDKVKGSPVI